MVSILEIKTKRVYQLEVGDVFWYFGRQYIVTNINERIWYRVWNSTNIRRSFGLFNQSRVEYYGRDNSYKARRKSKADAGSAEKKG